MKTDHRIIERIRSGDPSGMDMLYDTYAPVVYGFLMRQENDMQQAGALLTRVFAEAEQKIQQAAPSEIRLSLWLLAIARDLAATNGRKQQALNQLADAVGQAGGQATDVQQNWSAGIQLVQTLHEQKCSAAEVAQALGWTVEEVGRTVRAVLVNRYSARLT